MCSKTQNASIIGKRLLAVIFCCCLAVWLSRPVNVDADQGLFDKLQAKLVKDGLSKKRVQALYQNPAVIFETKGVTLFFMHNEATLNYDQFKNKSNISKARKYMQKYKPELAMAKNRLQVGPEIITAIMLVETRLGKYVGKRSIINTLSTLSTLSDPVARDYLWKHIPESRRFSKQQFNKKAVKKSKWAYRELKAFLKYTAEQKMDPVKIRGSHAGAMGISQFMPTNILIFAKDGNQDGRLDLFTHADAIMSIASYLKHYGWKPGLPKKKAGKVIYHYNHSKYYVKIILDIEKILRLN